VKSELWAVAFSPDNRWLVTGSWGTTARLRLLQAKDLITLAPRTGGRNLSINEWQKVLPAQPYKFSLICRFQRTLNYRIESLPHF
jgi:WD40 repeat protein